ncbi:MAG: site-specific integrase [Euzebyales bacterium]|nr:site-specific integrase [Euzebyales bacterium]
MKRLKPKAKRCPCGSDHWTWCVVADVAHGGGKRRQTRRQGFSTREEADAALREILGSVDNGSYVVLSDQTLGEFLADRWLPAMRPPRLEATTWVEYRRKVANQVVPRLGHIKLQKLNPLHLNSLYADLLESGRMNGRGGLSAKTVREMHVILHKALGDAVRWGLLARNVALLADPPSHRMASAARQATMRTWTAEQLLAFLEHVRHDRLSAVWMLAASSGMRRSELGGVRWRDILFDAGRLAVRQRLASVDGKPQLSVPKSPRGRRTIDLDRRTLDALKLHREQQLEERAAWGGGWHDLDLVVTREDGHWIHPDWITELFRRHGRDAGLPHIRLHDLRHTHATLLLEAGANPKVVSERLGHHSVAFTLDTYAHVLPGMQAEAAQSFSDLVFGIVVEPVRTDEQNASAKTEAGTVPKTRTATTARRDESDPL